MPKKESTMLTVDWSVRKELHILDVQKDKLHKIEPTTDAFQKFLNKQKDHLPIYFEEGGADSLKLLAYRRGNSVFTIPGIRVKQMRDKISLEKDDTVDAKILGLLAKTQPNSFYKFEEADRLIAEISIWFRYREKIEKHSTALKNQFFAISNLLELVDTKDKVKILMQQKQLIAKFQKLFDSYTRILEKKVKSHPLWESLFSKIKGVGSTTAGGILSQIKNPRRFPTRYNLRSYAGMKKRKGNQNFCHPLKRALYFFAKGILMAKDPIWYQKLLDFKEHYKKQHPNWKKGKVHNFAIKLIQSKFLDETYRVWKKLPKGLGELTIV